MEAISDLDRSFYPTIITPASDVVSEQAAELQAMFREQIAQVSDGAVLLDLCAVKAIDSMGVSLLVGLVKELRKQSRELHILVQQMPSSECFNHAVGSTHDLLSHGSVR